MALSGTGVDFTISATPASQTIAIPKATTFTLTLTPVSGLTGAVSLACSGGPANSTCLISPANLTLNGSNSVTATVSISFAKNSGAKGAFSFTLTGTSRVSHQTQVTVTVR